MHEASDSDVTHNERPAFGLRSLVDTRPVLSHAARYGLIDLLRGFAAFCVLLRHYQHFYTVPGLADLAKGNERGQPLYAVFWPMYDYGQYAVQVFWTISGFVFASVYAARRSTAGAFVRNRFARLYPLHLTTLLVVAGLQACSRAKFGGTWIYSDNTWPYFLLHLGLASNWSGRFPFTFNGPIWSVSVEVVVYAAFWLALPRLFSRGVVGPLVMAVVFFAVKALGVNDLIGSCGMYFFGGAAVYVLHDRWRAWPGRQRMAACGLLGIGAVAIAGRAQTLLCVAPISAGLVLGLAALEATSLAVRARPLRWIGDGTYGMYLWHFPIQLSFVLALPGFGPGRERLASPWFLLLYLGLVMAVARASFLWLESPAQRWLRGVGPSGRPARADAGLPVAGP